MVLKNRLLIAGLFALPVLAIASPAGEYVRTIVPRAQDKENLLGRNSTWQLWTSRDGKVAGLGRSRFGWSLHLRRKGQPYRKDCGKSRRKQHRASREHNRNKQYDLGYDSLKGRDEP
jgi:hypothetical protein